ncbi:MAG: TIGR00159 family protein [Deltaproteobacteria bacterium CG07_land_8_20_14_0_80_60_11]|nr:MAG: TIGR00159 family protein [Deltaproteobacteria bacterium CG07_land_8_20_14_0_80_60_11]
MWQFLSNLRWQDGVDIILVAIIIYQVVLVLRGTQAVQVLAGLFLLFAAYLVARQLEFFTLEWLLDIIVKSFVLIVIILFQADIRRVLSRMGKKALAPGGIHAPLTVEEVCEAAGTMASRYIGALIVMERYIGLSDFLEGAIKLDALVTKELLVTLFWPHSPTHDGAVILQGDRAVAAGCLMPLSRNPNLDPALGTRHRAAVGITEQSDALALVVSETSGQISLAQGGKLKRDLTRLQLRQALQDLLETPAHNRGNWFDQLVRHFKTQ